MGEHVFRPELRAPAGFQQGLFVGAQVGYFFVVISNEYWARSVGAHI